MLKVQFINYLRELFQLKDLKTKIKISIKIKIMIQKLKIIQKLKKKILQLMQVIHLEKSKIVKVNKFKFKNRKFRLN